jgi:anti-sigma B factor antagonist
MSQAELDIQVNRKPTEAVVTAVGEIDGGTVHRLSEAVEGILLDAPPRIVLDLEGVTFCDSQGLGTLVTLSQKARMMQSVLVITNVGNYLTRVLDITGLRQVLLIS